MLVRLGDYIDITNGYAFKSSLYSKTGGRVIRITNVQKGKIEDENPKFYPDNLLGKIDRYRIYENDILMSLTGNVGRVGRFPKGMLPAYINQRVCRVKSNTKKLFDDYLFHILNSNEFEERAIKSSTGIAQLNMSTKWLEEFQIPLPPLEIQKHIAEILDNAAALRDKTKQLLEEYHQLAQNIFLEMFGNPVMNPKGWKKNKIKNLGKTITGNTPPRSNPDFYGDFIEWIKTDNINTPNMYLTQADEYLSQLGMSKGRIVDAGAILVTCIAGSRKVIGNVSIADRQVSFNQQINAFVPSNNYSLFWYYQFIIGKPYVQNNSTNGMKGIITKSKFQEMEFISPPINLQKQFTKKAILIEQQKELAKQELKESEDLFQALLQKAFKGELVKEKELEIN